MDTEHYPIICDWVLQDGYGFRGSWFGFRILCLVCRVSCFVLRVAGSGFGVV